MRVVVASDSIGALSALDAATAIAEGWSGEHRELVPLGEAGAGFAQAMADLSGGARSAIEDHLVVDAPGLLAIGARAASLIDGAPIPTGASSAALGSVLRTALQRCEHADSAVLLDLTGQDVHDAGAGLLAALGAEADVDLTTGAVGLDGLTRLDLSSTAGALAGRTLVGVTSEAERDRPLLGLRGITSLRGRSAGTEPEAMLRTDAALERLARAAEAATGRALADRPGAGAHGGLGLAILALGGRLTTGPRLGLELAGISRTPGTADLVLTGCTSYDFAHRGGGVIGEVAGLAADTLAPCVVLAGEVLIGGREMRTMGVEAAYPVFAADAFTGLGREPDVVDAAKLSTLARRVARSWTW